MLAKRIIPCLDIQNGRVVKGINFLNLRDAGDPVEQAIIYDRRDAKWPVLCITFIDELLIPGLKNMQVQTFAGVNYYA